jgi:FLVCR family feline leukemia virus subgroup C receptor-related protein
MASRLHDENGNLQPNEKNGSKCVLDSPSPTTEVTPIHSTVHNRTYPKRFVVLALFGLCSMCNAFQWIEYAIVSSMLGPYFSVSLQAINVTSLLYMFIYIPGVLPASWILARYGLRVTVLIGAFGTCLGSAIKCFCQSPDHFHILLAGQAISATSQLFIINVPPSLAAVWFAPGELSSATSVGVFGNQLGVALGFVVPPLLIVVDNVGLGLSRLHMYQLIAASTVCLLLLCLFDKQPPTAPSAAQSSEARGEASTSDHIDTLRKLFGNRDFNLLFLSYGINVGVFYALSTLLEQMLNSRFPNSSTEAGQMGLLLTVSGMFGSVSCGLFLDRTHRYKHTTVGLYILSLLGMCLYSGALYLPVIWPLFLVCVQLGFFMTGYLPIGFEFAAELTFPQPEGTSAGLLNASAQVRSCLLLS